MNTRLPAVRSTKKTAAAKDDDCITSMHVDSTADNDSSPVALAEQSMERTAVGGFPSSRTALKFSVALGLTALFTLHISRSNAIDPDVFHQMALYRQTLIEGSVPQADRFAFTPTVSPSVHHEWGHGVFLYYLASAGTSAVVVAKYLLAIGVAFVCILAAARRGANLATIAMCVPLAIVLGEAGFTTIRAQVWTLLFTAAVVLFLHEDRQGRRKWIAVWLPMYVLWINLHAGFVVGVGLIALHGIELILRRKSVTHLLLVAAAMVPLSFVNPYGVTYFSGIAHSIFHDRSLISEWVPILQSHNTTGIFIFLFAVLIAAYALLRLGWRQCPGLLGLAACTYQAFKHERLVFIFAVVWLCLVPAYLVKTPLGRLLGSRLTRHQNSVAVVCLLLAVALFGTWGARQPLRLDVPCHAQEQPHAPVIYPVGAVDFLEAEEFKGKIVTPFVVGQYVSWRLHPRVLVSLDGRYEAAYPRHLLPEHIDFYAAKPGWQEFLTRYRPDAVLVKRSSSVGSSLRSLVGWTLHYQDDSYLVFMRDGVREESPVDHRGRRLSPRFP